MRWLWIVGFLAWSWAGAASALELLIEDHGGKRYVHASGVIDTAGYWQLVSAILSDRPVIVTMDSVGGDVAAAIGIGGALRYAGAEVRVPRGATCVSSCVLVLAGGSRRVVEAGAYVGVHQFYGAPADATPAEVESYTQRVSANILDHLRAMGISSEVFTIASRVPPSEMRALSVDELRRFGLTTR